MFKCATTMKENEKYDLQLDLQRKRIKKS